MFYAHRLVPELILCLKLYEIRFKQSRYLILQHGQLNATTMANLQTVRHTTHHPSSWYDEVRLKLNPMQYA
jgi:hypothetical protein